MGSSHHSSDIFAQCFASCKWKDLWQFICSGMDYCCVSPSKDYSWIKRNIAPQKRPSACSTAIWPQSITAIFSSSTLSGWWSHTPVIPTSGTQFKTMANWLTFHLSTYIWVTQKIFRLACHSVWRCSGVWKEDVGRTQHLTMQHQISP